MTKRQVKEGLSELADVADRDHEVQMARAELYKLAEYSVKLYDLLKGISEAEGLEGWQQAKITKASDYISSVYHSLNYEKKAEGGDATIDAMNTMAMAQAARESADPYKSKLHLKLQEKAKSKAQQKFMGMVHAAQKGEKPASKEVAKVAKDMPKKAAKDYAATKHKGKPEHVKKKNESFDVHAKKILGEGKDYQNYLELSEAPIGDVVNKIKTSISKLSRPVAAKAVQAVKSVPRSALPIIATVLMSLAAQGASAGQSDIQAQLNKLDQTISQISTTGNGGVSQGTLNKFNATSNDLTKSFNGTLDNLPGADATKSAGTTEVTRDQLKALNAKLGGGSGPTLTDLIKNGVNTDKVKNILTKMNLTDPMYIETALQQIQGSDLLPMINWIKNNK